MALRAAGQHAGLAEGQPGERLLLPRQARLPSHGRPGRVPVQGGEEVSGVRLVAPLHVRRPGKEKKLFTCQTYFKYERFHGFSIACLELPAYLNAFPLVHHV